MAEVFNLLTWKWGTKYSAEYVNKLAASARRNLPPEIDLQFICATDDPTGLRPEILVAPLDVLRVEHLLKHHDGCWARLVVFSPDFVRTLQYLAIPIYEEDYLTVMDLDAVIVGNLFGIHKRLEKFIIAKGIHYLKTPFNGSMIRLRLGSYPEIWETFTVAEAEKYLYVDGEFQSTDQSWLYAKLRTRSGQFTPRGSGVYGLEKPGWNNNSTDLPSRARVIFFPGHRDPGQPELQKKYPWIQQHWRE